MPTINQLVRKGRKRPCNKSKAKWKRGDVVRLKSGGPKMTIMGVPDSLEYILSYGITCKWFDGCEVHEAIFDSEALMRAAKGAR